MKSYLGFIAAVIGAALMWLIQANSDDVLTDVEKIQVVVASATAASVYLAANVPGLEWAKTAVAVVLGASNFLAGAIADGLSSSDWYGLAVVILTAVGVFVAPAPQWSGQPVDVRSSLTRAP